MLSTIQRINGHPPPATRLVLVEKPTQWTNKETALTILGRAARKFPYAFCARIDGRFEAREIVVSAGLSIFVWGGREVESTILITYSTPLKESDAAIEIAGLTREDVVTLVDRLVERFARVG